MMENDENTDKCPLETIPGLAPPVNLTGRPWVEVWAYSNSARDLGVGAFLCTNCSEKGEEDPWFYFEDGYAFIHHPSVGNIGACRRCAPELEEMDKARVAARRRRVLLFVMSLLLLGAAVLWFAV
jgi:hypothetical protein